MAYTAYKTWTVGEVLTAANMNAQVRDNGLLGPEALAAADGEMWIATAVNAGEMIVMVNSGNEIIHEQGGLEGDFSAGDGLVQIKAGVTTVIKSNIAASDAPDANDDSGSGYSIGSLWIDTVNDAAYTCVDATSTAAVWASLQIASQSQMEAATDLTTTVSPGRAQFHPGTTKVWVKWEQSGAHGISASYNMDSVTDGGAAGDSDLLWTRDFSGTSYSLVHGADINFAIHLQPATLAAGGVSALTQKTDDLVDTDINDNMVAISGDQV